MPERSTQPNPFQQRLPNALTMLRLGLAALFFVAVSLYRFPETNPWALPLAAALFIIAAVTDAFDGYFARRWNATSTFGRIMDPFADKVLVLGAFVMLAGTPFTNAENLQQVSGVAPWMAVVILARELLVTSIRGVCESMGIDFSASTTGKLKMILQSIAVPFLIILVWFMAAQHNDSPRADLLLRLAQGTAWLVTLVTAASALPYLSRGITALRERTGPS